MTISKNAILVFVGCLTLTSCNQGTQSSPPAPSAPLPPKVPDISEEVRKLQTNLLKLQFRVDALESGGALVSTEEQGYGIAKTNFGAFTISANAVTPYLDGFKVKLRIGNLTSANFNGAKIAVSWGGAKDIFEQIVNDVEGGSKNRKKKEVSVTNQFPSGAFTDLEVVLTPAKPEEIKTLWVGIQLDQLALRVQ